MAHDDHGDHHAPYFMVFVALCVCTLLSAAADIVDLRAMLGYFGLVVIVFSIAVAKALFVMVYFMHLKFEGRWKYVLLAPTVILAIGLPLALLPDIGVHYYTELSTQKQFAAEHGHVHGGHDSEHSGEDSDH